MIWLGFGRIMGFPAKYCGLLAVSIAYKVLKYNGYDIRRNIEVERYG